VYWLDEREQLFDLHTDPNEFVDLGAEATHASQREAMRARLLVFLAKRKHRTTVSDAFIEARTNQYKKAGVFFGQW
jgi:hypothetical protein